MAGCRRSRSIRSWRERSPLTVGPCFCRRMSTRSRKASVAISVVFPNLHLEMLSELRLTVSG